MNNIQTRLEGIISEYTRDDITQLSLQDNLADVGIDSLGLVEIIFDIEENFDINIPSEAECAERGFSFASYEDVVHIVTTLVKEKEK